MISAWLAYALLVGALLALAARVLETGVRLTGLPGRMVWAGALLAILLLAALSPLRRTLPSEASVPPASPGLAGGAAAAIEPDGVAPLAAFLSTLTSSARAALALPLTLAARVGSGVDGARLGRAFVALWMVSSVLLMALFGATLLRFRSARRRWPVCEMAGERVRVSASEGPAVVGLVRPEIVVPAWLLEAESSRQRLVIAHEKEHVRAGDHALLAFGGLALALLPWHPAVWWILGRLRLAVELDCDARVLRRGAARAIYGSLLVDMADPCSGLRSELRSGLPFGASALADAPSHLERRLLAMTNQRPRFAAARGVALAALGSLLVLAACEAELPTSQEIEAMDVAAFETGAATMRILGDGQEVTYVVDGVIVSKRFVSNLGPETIASVEVVRRVDDTNRSAIKITTVAAEGREATVAGEEREALVPEEGREALAVKERSPDAEAGRVVVLRERSATEAFTSGFNGVLLVNGERAEPDAMARLRPEDIESIEVVKGAAAMQIYADPAAQNGVIRITLKPGVTLR